ncbi:unnamed protein product [Bursaphelenchus xylophilus]|uniref:(pine wood nematode) hypothetical protein n=1 Tax=Bursaphelenchus xylophilus TaxID=6326 RepID=A0A1I7SKX5_BURXY|nr:unnamed protein product [Bursaphelenchus xylophilus]CAG9129283.1 unnamed protein product [Bursaphelenchus xylophilus]
MTENAALNNNVVEKKEVLPKLSAGKYDISFILINAVCGGIAKIASKCADRVIVPPSAHPLLNISAVEAAEKIRNKQLKSFDLLQAYFARIRDVNPYINAVTELFEYEALEKAKEVDAYIETIYGNPGEIEKLRSEQPLFGIPISLKHVFDYKGHRNIGGLEHRRELPPAEKNCEHIRRVLNAGAIPICFTNVPSGACFFESDNTVHGRSCNPFDTRCTPGGSSGGEAALIAAQGSLLGLGTDLGGSIRVPAMLCGVYGHKPGRTVPDDSLVPPAVANTLYDGFFCGGPLARYPEDAALLNAVIFVEPIPKQLSELAPSVLYAAAVDEKPFLVNSNSVRSAYEDAKAFISHAYNLSIYDFNIQKSLMEYVILLKSCAFDADNLANLHEHLMPDGYPVNVFKELVKSLVGASSISPVTLPILCAFRNRYPESFIKECCRQLHILRDRWHKALKGDVVLVFPAVPETHYFHLSYGILPSMNTLLFNCLGLSSLAVPMGKDKDGYPLSVQLVGHPDSDNLLFSIAAKMKTQFGGWVKTKDL